MASMLENIQTLLTPAVLSRVAGQTGEPEASLTKGIGAVIPTIAAMVAWRSDDRGFMKDMADLAASTSENSNAIASAAERAFSPNATGTMSATDRWLSDLFGRNLSGLAESVASYAGIRGSAAASLLSIGAPLVLTSIGRWMRRDHLNVSELSEELRDRRAEFASALPAGFELPTGLRVPFQALRSTMDEEGRPMAPPVAPVSETTGPNVPALILISVLGLGGLLWWGVRQYHEHAQASIDRGMSTLAGTAGTASGIVTRTLPGDVSLSFARGGLEDGLLSYLSSGAKGVASFEFDRIGFESGSASLTPQSREQLRNVAAILVAYPSAFVMVEGYTDNVGDEGRNVALSRARAVSVAHALMDAGVASNRVGAEGFGSRKPIASNATAAGREQNRRVMLDVNAR